MRAFFLFLCLQIGLWGTDFDCILIGTSPFSLFEALYQSHSGKKVLILEESDTCGGAWKSIDICGIPHADLGCHQIGHDKALKEFLEVYAGCKIVSLDQPNRPFDGNGQNGWYFSQGCFELIQHLLKLIEATDIVLLLNTKAEKAFVDSQEKQVIVHTKNQEISTRKLILTPMSSLILTPSQKNQIYPKRKHHHLYLLVQDPSPPRFSYESKVAKGVSRAMNLTHFVGLAQTGRQLIALQTQKELDLSEATTLFQELKRLRLLDASAYLLQAEPYTYETGSFHQGMIEQTKGKEMIELIQTGSFSNLTLYIKKWKEKLANF